MHVFHFSVPSGPCLFLTPCFYLLSLPPFPSTFVLPLVLRAHFSLHFAFTFYLPLFAIPPDLPLTTFCLPSSYPCCTFFLSFFLGKGKIFQKGGGGWKGKQKRERISRGGPPLPSQTSPPCPPSLARRAAAPKSAFFN